ncbi:MAG: response regulator, partial [Rubrimonas sp.]
LMLDISMPDLDGADALARIRAEEAARGLPAPPALAVTANVLPDQVQEYLAAGFAAHLPKPVRRDQLGAALAALAAAD